MQESSFLFDSFDGKKIFVRQWAPKEEPKFVFQIFHGMAEHSGRYAKLAEYLTSLGFLVFADDHRAHGNTDMDTLGYCKGSIWKDTLKDLQLLNRSYKQKYPNLKYIVFGHSYGSFLLQAYLQQTDRALYDGVILSGSAKMQGAQPCLGKVVASLGAPKKPANLIKKLSFDAYNKKFKDGDFISSIEEQSKRYQDDELCGFVCSNNFYKNFFGGLKGIYSAKNLNKIKKTLSMLIFSGDKDPVGDFGKSVTKLYETYIGAGLTNVTFKLFKDNRHEVLNDISANESYKLISDFVFSLKGQK